MAHSIDNRIFHGNITPRDFAQALMGEFRGGAWMAQHFGNPEELVVQITSRDHPTAGGRTALAVTLRQVGDGVAVQIGRQAWLGVAASLGQTVLETLHNPWRLLGRLDDLAQDVESLQLTERVWMVIESAARLKGATLELSERLRRLVCDYCDTANPVGEPACIACGAPLGRVQPRTCRHCGFVVRTGETVCPNCKRLLT
jgi:hypothetical protein